MNAAESPPTEQPNALFVPEMAWQPLPDFPGPAESKILREPGVARGRTMLVRIPPGASISPHGQRSVVQHLVQEGEYESHGVVYSKGMYRLLPGHTDVPEITTRTGVTILIIIDPLRSPAL